MVGLCSRPSLLANEALLAALLVVSAFGGASAAGGFGSFRRAVRLRAGDADSNSNALALNTDSLPEQASVGKGNATSMSLAAASIVAAKPIRIARGGDMTHRRRRSTKSTLPSHLHCGATAKVNSGSNKDDKCPDECPFFAQDRTDKDFCTFSCVKEPACASMYPTTQIGDKELGVCRSCIVDGCKECDTSVMEDKCKTCQAGYVLTGDGMCHFKYAGDWMYYVAGVFAVLGVIVVIWVLDMIIRPANNAEVLDQALEAREKQKFRMKKDATGVRPLFPMFTNLLRTQVAGPGMQLHFNFQFALIFWAAFVALVWICFAQFIDPALWVLGTRRFGTARENCILVAWGYETQQRLMWTKVLFLYITYIGSFLMCMAYGVYQLRAFQDADYQHKTMKDFAAMIVGLPSVEGSKNVEGDLKARIEDLGAQSVVGVSVAWDYQEHEESIKQALDADLEARMIAVAGSPERAPLPEMNPVRKSFYTLEQMVFGLDSGNGGGSDEIDSKEEELRELLNGLRTSQRAFVVFETQEARDQAVELAAGGFEYEHQGGIVLWTLDAEPDTVQWVNYGHATAAEKTLKLLAGFGFIILACLFWAVIFYAPYAYYVMTFNYENGRQPGPMLSISFSMIVVVGNAIMYEVCAQVSDWVGFRFKDNREACYMILYTVACMFNVALDFITTYYTAEKVMEGLGFRTYFGVPLEDVTEFTAKFETYGMQRSLAENTYAYAFPSTYLIPFLIEPFPTIIAPLFLGRLIVRSHPEVMGRDAEEWVGMAPMEMGRYADLLLNTILGILIFYFPGGYTWMLFLGMAGSHVWIYVFDHYRVLRSIPACTFASFDVEWWAQAIMAPIIGIMAACLVFKSNCEPGYHCLRGPSLILICFAGWLVHTVFHLIFLTYVVPKFGKPEPAEDPAAGETFASLCHHVPCSWFTSNPVHCLRSKLKLQHNPPCSFYFLGKEKYMKTNKAIGCYFEEASDEKSK
mmetsp:Transcript_68021/g.172132  ORF Transcript_68021/g.172132 Transcript_68021/m.172132 type:complete len:974 (-) Transcript_68021:135-3056(-)